MRLVGARRGVAAVPRDGVSILQVDRADEIVGKPAIGTGVRGANQGRQEPPRVVEQERTPEQQLRARPLHGFGPSRDVQRRFATEGLGDQAGQKRAR
jgi:hypothetical protein